MQCKLSRFQLLSRRQYGLYAGKPAVGGGGYVYVVSDTVAQSRYRVLFFASLISGPSGAASAINLPGQLIIIPNGVPLPTAAAGSVPDDPFFLNYFQFGGRAFGPSAAGIRIDNQATGAVADQDLFSRTGDEMVMLKNRDFVLIGPGETVMGWQQQYGTASNPAIQMQMRLCYTDLQQTEDFDY